MDYNEKFCEQQHREINKTLETHDKRLTKHGEQLDSLEKSDAVNTTQIGSLLKKMDKLTNSIWGLSGSIILVLLGFLIWYIQTL